MYELAQLSEAAKPVIETAEHLSAQSISVWFVIVVLLFGGGIFWVIKLLLKQWSEQRQVAAELQSRLFDYITKDHQASAILQRETNVVMGDVVKLLKEIMQDRHDNDILNAAKSGTAVVRGPSKETIK